MPKAPSTYSLIPKELDTTQAILMCIGKLIAVWANTEACFYAVYFCLSGHPSGNADIAWASILSTRRRMDLVYNLLRYENELDAEIKTELFECLERFRAVTEFRNQLCHSMYTTEPPENEKLVSIDQWSLAPIKNITDPIFKEKSKLANAATINEICCIADRCMEINERVTKSVYKIRDQLKLQHVVLPPLQLGPQ
ncbi:hypothetical protein [Bradyrhizobium roseum]|uniref:hypothetical protein n=1 Tax=Bradyrhizobium roseum TaxID=3056648 RepID=UPI00260EB53E|nr:hypothetical protein [Bradyrhizobium roseus]WKA27063.1 hypothetical protein QUH67_26310 [Bradyrhizobium roseus]